VLLPLPGCLLAPDFGLLLSLAILLYTTCTGFCVSVMHAVALMPGCGATWQVLAVELAAHAHQVPTMHHVPYRRKVLITQ
jgi:hypothetical protein